MTIFSFQGQTCADMMDHNYWIQSNSSVTESGESNGSNHLNKPAAVELSPSTSNESLQFSLDDGTAVIVQIHNMLCNYTLPMHIDLRMVAYRNINVDHDRFRGVLVKQLRNPPCHVKIYNSGKIVIMQCKSENECKRAARSIGRMVQRSMNKLDQKIRIRNFRVNNIMATCRMPFGIRIEDLARKYRAEGAKYEPELMIGLEWAIEEPKANLRIHTTGSITITGATSEAGLIESIKKVYPFLKEFACQRGEKKDGPSAKSRRRPRTENSQRNGHRGAKKSRKDGIDGTGVYGNLAYFSDEDEMNYDEEEYDEEFEGEEEDNSDD